MKEPPTAVTVCRTVAGFYESTGKSGKNGRTTT